MDFDIGSVESSVFSTNHVVGLMFCDNNTVQCMPFNLLKSTGYVMHQQV